MTHLLAHFVQEKHLPIISICVWAAFAASACYRKFNKKVYYRKEPIYYPKFNKPIYRGHVIAALIIIVVLVFVIVGRAGWINYSWLLRFPEAPSEELNVQRELLNVQEELGEMQKEQLDVQEELREIQSEQLKVEKGLLDAQNAGREKKEDAPPRPPPKHQNRSVQ